MRGRNETHAGLPAISTLSTFVVHACMLPPATTTQCHRQSLPRPRRPLRAWPWRWPYDWQKAYSIWRALGWAHNSVAHHTSWNALLAALPTPPCAPVAAILGAPYPYATPALFSRPHPLALNASLSGLLAAHPTLSAQSPAGVAILPDSNPYTPWWWQAAHGQRHPPLFPPSARWNHCHNVRPALLRGGRAS